MSDYYHDNYYRIVRHVDAEIEKAEKDVKEAKKALENDLGNFGYDEVRAKLFEATVRLKVLNDLSDDLNLRNTM